MDFTEAVQWWGDWQLRILVLGSLFLQYFLLVTAVLRKCRIPVWLRLSIWLAYLGSDAVAIYALATLLSHQKKREWVSKASKNAALEALWAPVILLHLGGQDGITAFSIEDNELWKRHVLTAASQIAVAIYVFCKSQSGDIRLFQATILIFVPGILKCLEKPWALNKASIYSMANNIESGAANPKRKYSLGDYVNEAKQYLDGDSQIGLDAASPHRLFVDLSYPYKVRLNNLKYMAGKRDNLNFELHSRLFKTFDRFYTKSVVYNNSWRGTVVRIVSTFLTFAAIALFHTSHREAYSNIDINITYVLLCCTASLEFISTWLKWCEPFFLWMIGLSLPDHVAQYNTVWYLASMSKKHNRLLQWLASQVGCEDRLDRFRCMKTSEGCSITVLIHDHVINEGWKKTITDAVTYRRFSDNRGQLTLKSYLSEDYKALKGSIERPFDESVLLWHLATDFCFYKKKPSCTNEAAKCCRTVSNYMAYLLFVRPEMLMPGTRHRLFKAASRKLEILLGGESDEKEEKLGSIIVNKMEKMVRDKREEKSFLHEAWELAEDLMRLDEVAKEGMWKLIQGVWVEMLCFSASRSRGFLHAESLGKGGEYLSCVWLLLWYLGMETFAVKLQRTEIQEKGDVSADVQVPKVPPKDTKQSQGKKKQSQEGTKSSVDTPDEPKMLESESSVEPLVQEYAATGHDAA